MSLGGVFTNKLVYECDVYCDFYHCVRTCSDNDVKRSHFIGFLFTHSDSIFMFSSVVRPSVRPSVIRPLTSQGQYWAGKTPPPNNPPPNMAAANFVVMLTERGARLMEQPLPQC